MNKEDATNGEAGEKKSLLNLKQGSPGALTLKGCSEIMLEATKTILHKDADEEDIFAYGYEGGDEEFRHQLAQFLSEEYGDRVDKDCLTMTAGATHGIHQLMTVLVPVSSPVFVIDPSYFYGQMIMASDLQRTLVAVPTDSDGPIMDVFENSIKAHLPEDGNMKTNDKIPFWAAVYILPVFNNPTGATYSHEKCKEMISLARKYNLLLLAEDVYNLIYFNDVESAPKRLLAFDTPSDPDYGVGHVVSNCTFSKIFAPAIRLGWIEGPKEIIQLMANSNISLSGGAFNHYVGKIVTEILRSGKEKEHVKWLRSAYKATMTSLCDSLEKYLPQGCSFNRPEGGYFVWVQLGTDIDAEEFLDFCEQNHKIRFLPGAQTSPSQSFKNCIRLSASYLSVPTLSTAGKYLWEAYNDFLSKKNLA